MLLRHLGPLYQIQLRIKARRYAAKLVVLVNYSGLRDDARVEGFLSRNFLVKVLSLDQVRLDQTTKNLV